MAAKSFVQGDCGTQNVLVQFSKNVLDETSSRQVVPFLPVSKHHEFVDEYLRERQNAAVHPSDFSMQSLVNAATDLKLADQNTGRSRHQQWIDEFTAGRQNVAPSTLENVWAVSARNNEQDFGWANEYLSRFEHSTTAVPTTVALSDQWAREIVDAKTSGYLDEAWTEAAGTSVQPQKEADGKIWSDFDKAWADEISEGTSNRWLDEFGGVDESQSMDEYKFRDENPYADVENALEEGKKRLAEGHLGDAILLFEAAVKSSPDNSEAWQYLGITLAENEQELPAIAALKRSVAIDAGNYDAHLALAVSYTNESLLVDACNSLRSWARAKYPSLFPSVSGESGPAADLGLRVSSFLHPEEFERIENELLTLANRNGHDASLQNALGVLYNMAGDYQKAVECFQTALQMDPNNGRLWNRLGATLANGDRSAEAIPAYDRALRLYPGFVRSRYNLGIACVNLQAHGEAATHFVSALILQKRGIGPEGSEISNNVWNSLRFSVRQLADLDATSLVDKRDLDGLARRFNVTVE